MRKKTPPATDYLDTLSAFIDRSPTPFHVVKESTAALAQAGFRPLLPDQRWTLRPGDAGYVTRNGSALIAFRIGSAFTPENGAFQLVAAHTDSPALRLKLRGATAGGGTLRLPVEVYGGGINSTWLDRPLGVSGRYVVTDANGPRLGLTAEHGVRPVIPNLAIHLNQEANNGFTYNPQQHLAALCGEGSLRDFLAAVCGEAAAAAGEELAAELFLHDAVPVSRGGLRGEWLQGPRLDNLCSCFAALSAIAESPADDAFARVIFLADHEEIGSLSAQGADSAFLRDTLFRLTLALPDPQETFLRLLARSTLLSCDAAHGWHPNFPEVADPGHRPLLNGGIVIKHNVAQRYATCSPTAARFEHQLRQAGLPFQHFAVRADQRCGSTIGPVCTALLGIPGCDVGIPLWGMHSCRETAGSRDQLLLRDAITAFWNP